MAVYGFLPTHSKKLPAVPTRPRSVRPPCSSFKFVTNIFETENERMKIITKSQGKTFFQLSGNCLPGVLMSIYLGPVMSGSFLCFMTLRIVASSLATAEQNHFDLIKPSPFPGDGDDDDQGPTCRCRASIHMALSLSLSLSLWSSVASPSSYGFFTTAIVVQLLTISASHSDSQKGTIFLLTFQTAPAGDVARRPSIRHRLSEPNKESIQQQQLAA